MNNKIILIVDDSESDQFITKHLLQKHYTNIEVHSAYDGREAMDMLTGGIINPDIILLDINMPGMDGFAFLEEYKTLDHASSLIIMLTSSDQQKDIEKVKQYPFVKKYCLKPIDVDSVQDLL